MDLEFESETERVEFRNISVSKLLKIFVLLAPVRLNVFAARQYRKSKVSICGKLAEKGTRKRIREDTSHGDPAKSDTLFEDNRGEHHKF